MHDSNGDCRECPIPNSDPGLSSDDPRVLCIDDDADIVQAAGLVARRRGMALAGAANPQAAWSRLAEGHFDIILLDLNFARGDTSGEEGFRMLADLMAADPRAVVIVITGHSGINIAVEAMRAGASDFVIKPWSNDRLGEKLDRALALSRARRAGAGQSPAEGSPVLLGDDPDLARVRTLIARVAPTRAPIMFFGPAGCGKTLAARLVHNQSAEAERPITTLAVHADLTPTDIDVALAASQGAMLVIDNVPLLPRALQSGLASRLAGRRIVATARGDRAALRTALDSDLLAKLNTIEIALPALADRGDDKLLLARHFIARFAHRHGRPEPVLSPEAERAILADSWPDDVRGLCQAIERAVLLASGEAITVADLALGEDDPAEAGPRAGANDLNLERTERRLIEAALDRHRFNISRAADELGLTRAALYRRMAKYGL